MDFGSGLKLAGAGFTIVLIGLFLKDSSNANAYISSYDNTLSVLEKAG